MGRTFEIHVSGEQMSAAAAALHSSTPAYHVNFSDPFCLRDWRLKVHNFKMNSRCKIGYA